MINNQVSSLCCRGRVPQLGPDRGVGRTALRREGDVSPLQIFLLLLAALLSCLRCFFPTFLSRVGGGHCLPTGSLFQPTAFAIFLYTFLGNALPIFFCSSKLMVPSFSCQSPVLRQYFGTIICSLFHRTQIKTQYAYVYGFAHMKWKLERGLGRGSPSGRNLLPMWEFHMGMLQIMWVLGIPCTEMCYVTVYTDGYVTCIFFDGLNKEYEKKNPWTILGGIYSIGMDQEHSGHR